MEKIKLESTEIFVIADEQLESTIAEELKQTNEEEDAKKLEVLLLEAGSILNDVTKGN